MHDFKALVLQIKAIVHSDIGNRAIAESIRSLCASVPDGASADDGGNMLAQGAPGTDSVETVTTADATDD